MLVFLQLQGLGSSQLANHSVNEIDQDPAMLTLFLLAVVTWHSYMGWFRPWPVGIGLNQFSNAENNIPELTVQIYINTMFFYLCILKAFYPLAYQYLSHQEDKEIVFKKQVIQIFWLSIVFGKHGILKLSLYNLEQYIFCHKSKST